MTGEDEFKSWRADAACKDHPNPDWWFPSPDPEGRFFTKKAKRICADCPVRKECLASSLENRERFGIWGGLDEYERAAIFRNSARLAERRLRQRAHVANASHGA